MRICFVVILSFVLSSCVGKKVEIPIFSYDTHVNSIIIVQSSVGHGTGFYVGNGLFLTAKHVVENSEVTYYAITKKAEDKKINLEVVYRSPDIDLAVLKIKDENHGLTPLKLADDNAKIGDLVHMISNPVNYKLLSFSYSYGYVMKDGFIDKEPPYLGQHFLCQIARYFGSSGAPVFNTNGEVVGMLNMLILNSSIGCGLTIEAIRKDLVAKGFLKIENTLLKSNLVIN
ncbi:TPA: hypothetical protein DEP58_01955 [Patescibacteria group bacterium]|nr:MAG: hypothetical protein UU98_C0031G0005 [Parcubacteria group bacterium GW2011_GWD2_42_14]HCC05050.1 hypothetical protein [Patescibacteria group bacterium]